MKLYFMKKKALDYIKTNMDTLYVNYYREKTNNWIYELFDYDPFELFLEVPDFSLVPITNKKGELDLQNCKIMFSKLMNISESQASDERLWAGLCNGTFYEYVRERWDYANLVFKDPQKDASALLSRFFFKGGNRSGFFRNTLAKYWWVGHSTYRSQSADKFELLDALGSEDFVSKVNDLFYSNTFASNPVIISGICKAWKLLAGKGIKLTVKEHFRPTLQYFNAIGGGMLLDILSEEEISDLFFDYALQLYSGKEPSAVIISENGNDEEVYDDTVSFENIGLTEEIQEMREINMSAVSEAEDDDYEEDSNANVIGIKNSAERKIAKKLNALSGTPETAECGCTVTARRKRDGKMFIYNLPSNKDSTGWFDITEKMLHKAIGDTVCGGADIFTIEKIEW